MEGNKDKTSTNETRTGASSRASSRASSGDELAPFSERLKSPIGKQKVREVARDIGINEASLRGYVSGKTQLLLKAVIDIARWADVTVDWLATGDGPMRPEADIGHHWANEQSAAYAAVSVEVENPRDRAPSEAAAETDLERRLTPRQRAFLGYLDELTETQQQEVMRELQETKRLNDELFEELLTKKGRG